MFLWKEKEARKTGSKHKAQPQWNTYHDSTDSSGVTCGFQRREQEQIWIHVQQNSTLEERRETENLRKNLTSTKSQMNL